MMVLTERVDKLENWGVEEKVREIMDEHREIDDRKLNVMCLV